MTLTLELTQQLTRGQLVDLAQVPLAVELLTDTDVKSRIFCATIPYLAVFLGLPLPEAPTTSPVPSPAASPVVLRRPRNPDRDRRREPHGRPGRSHAHRGSGGSRT